MNPVQSASRLAQVRARLSLPLTRRATGLLDGAHQSIYKGHGIDFDDLHLYTPGEDVDDIDWKSTARLGQPVIRRYIREANINVVVGVDTGANMATLAPSGESKADIAQFVVSLVAYLARDRGDRVALVAADSRRLAHLPGRAGTAHLELAIRIVERQLEEAKALADADDPPHSDLNKLMDRMLTLFPRRSLMVLVTDGARPADEHVKLLSQLRVQHKVMVISVTDALPVAGTDSTRDIQTRHALPKFLMNRPELVAAAKQAELARQHAVTARLRPLDVLHDFVGSSDEVLTVFLNMLGRSSRVTR